MPEIRTSVGISLDGSDTITRKNPEYKFPYILISPLMIPYVRKEENGGQGSN
jgi:hypothetical protein